MNTRSRKSRPSHPSHGIRRAPALSLALLFSLSSAAEARGAGSDLFEGRPYGKAWSVGDAPAPRLEIDGSSVIVSGGEPGELAILITGPSRGQRSLPGGGEILVAGEPERFSGLFDADRRFEVDLGDSASTAGVMYVQAIAGGAEKARGVSLSRGLRLERVDEQDPGPEAPEANGFDPWQQHFPPIAVDSVLEALGRRDLGESLVRMLNSAGDELELEIEGSLTAGSGACLGGEVRLVLSVECADAGVYDLLCGGDVSFLAGVELVEGVEAQASAGVGTDHVWRFYSQDELEFGLAAFAVMQAMGPGAEIAAEGAYQASLFAQSVLDEARALFNVRAAALVLAENARRASEQAWSQAPWWAQAARRAALVALDHWMRGVRGLLQVANGARELAQNAADLAREACQSAFEALSWVHDSRVFLNDRVHGVELRFGVGAEMEASCGPVPGVDLGNVGGGVAVGLDRKAVLRWTGPFQADGESVAVSFLTEGEVEASAGFGVGGELAFQRELEVRAEFERVGGVFEAGDVTARVAIDLAGSGRVGAVVAAEGGAGRTLEIELDAADLARVGTEGLAALLVGDSSEVADVLAGTSARFALSDRLFAGLVLDFGVSYVGNGFSVEAHLRWSDHGAEIEEELPITEGLARIADPDALAVHGEVTCAAADQVVQVVESSVAGL